MSRSFGTLVQLNTLLQVCTKLGLARDGRMPDLGSDQGAKHKASELRARRGLGLFTELFTVRYTLPSIQLLATRTFRITPELLSAGGWRRSAWRGPGVAYMYMLYR